MSYMKLIKLLYLADRKRLLERGRPITFDTYYSLPHGPILSRTKELIDDGPSPGADSLWLKHITEPKNYMVSIKNKDFTKKPLRS